MITKAPALKQGIKISYFIYSSVITFISNESLPNSRSYLITVCDLHPLRSSSFPNFVLPSSPRSPNVTLVQTSDVKRFKRPNVQRPMFKIAVGWERSLSVYDVQSGVYKAMVAAGVKAAYNAPIRDAMHFARDDLVQHIAARRHLGG